MKNPPPIKPGDAFRTFATVGAILLAVLIVGSVFYWPRGKMTLFSSAVTLSYGDTLDKAIQRMGEPKYCNETSPTFQECFWQKGIQSIKATVHDGRLQELSGAENDSWQNPAVYQIVFDGPR